MRERWLRQFGENVRRCRLKNGLSQEALGSRSGSHRNYIGAVERGERNPTATKIIAIAKALECPVADLFVGLGPGEPGRRSS